MICDECGSKCYSHGTRERNIKDLDCGSVVTRTISIMRYKCSECGHFQSHPVIDSTGTSNILKSYIIRRCNKDSYTRIANDTGLSDSTVRNIFIDYIERNFISVQVLPQSVSMSKIIIGNTCYYMVYAINERKILDVTKNIFEWLRQKNTKYVKYVFCDICNNILKAIKTLFSNQEVTIIIDKQKYFHYIKNLFIRYYKILANEHNISLSKSNSMCLDMLMDVNVSSDIRYLWPGEFQRIWEQYVKVMGGKRVETKSVLINNFLNHWHGFLKDSYIMDRFLNIIKSAFDDIICLKPFSEFHFRYHIIENHGL